MTEEFTPEALAVVLILGILLLTNLTMGALLIGRLKEKHEEVWESLGNPELFSIDAMPQFRLISFVLRRKYRDLSDPLLRRYGNIAWLPFLLGLIGGGLIATFVVWSFLG